MLPRANAPSPPQVAQGRETLARVRDAIRALPDHEREVFLLRQNGDLTFEAVAGSLGIPVGTAKTRMRSALTRLRRVVETARPARIHQPFATPVRERLA
jgi:RNA polymerase sigma-70 factor (ECF subfamily)